MESGGRMITNPSPFNNHIEYGLRALFILHALYPKKCDLDHISYLDYIVVHSGDFNKGMNSLHAPTPNRKNEILIRRSLIEKGLSLFSKYCLIKPVYEIDGIYYELTDESTPFIDSLSEEYSILVGIRANWVAENYKRFTVSDLKEHIVNSWESNSDEIAFHIDYQEEIL